MRSGRANRHRLHGAGISRGYALVVWMVAVATAAMIASMAVTHVSQSIQREREDELLQRGDEIAGALAAYARNSGPAQRRSPVELTELLEDRRGFGMLRHLRRVWPDPLARGEGWGLVRNSDGAILGVFSRSVQAPLRQRPQRLTHADLPAATRYSDWVFMPREPAK